MIFDFFFFSKKKSFTSYKSIENSDMINDTINSIILEPSVRYYDTLLLHILFSIIGFGCILLSHVKKPPRNQNWNKFMRQGQRNKISLIWNW